MAIEAIRTNLTSSTQHDTQLYLLPFLIHVTYTKINICQGMNRRKVGQVCDVSVLSFTAAFGFIVKLNFTILSALLQCLNSLPVRLYFSA